MSRARLRPAALGVASLALALGPGCRAPRDPPAPQARGRFILISLDTLRADSLGAYGCPRPTSPFLDSLAARGTLFENAVVQLPGTLPSHMSIFTGLYPGEHGVYPPEAVLSPRITTLPEVLRAQGFRTAGHTEGGYMAGRYGFARGFEEWTDPHPLEDRGGRLVKPPEAVKRTFQAGLESLRRLRGADSFFLFLHTYSVHDPYDPPEPYRSQFWKGPPPPGALTPDGSELSAFNAGGRRLPRRTRDYYRALYDAQVRYTDDVLRGFFQGLDGLGLAEGVTVVITSDHGEEFLEHGKLAHEQVYHECLHVPLIVVGPGAKRARVPALVQSIDIAPTLYELAGVPLAARPRASGRSLVPLLGGAAHAPGREAYAEAFVTGDRTLYRQDEDGLHQYLRREPRRSGDSLWVTRSARFETLAPAVEFWAASFHEPRPLRINVDGRPLRTERLETTERQIRVALPPGGGKRVVELASPTCVSPASLGQSSDVRCLSFLLRGLAPSRSELYDLTRDPLSARDLSRERFALAAELSARLDALRFRPLAEPGRPPLDPEQERRLKALGYLQ